MLFCLYAILYIHLTSYTMISYHLPLVTLAKAIPIVYLGNPQNNFQHMNSALVLKNNEVDGNHKLPCMLQPPGACYKSKWEK